MPCPSVSANRRAPASTAGCPLCSAPSSHARACATAASAVSAAFAHVAVVRRLGQALHLALDRPEAARLAERAEEVERQDVRRPLPDGQHLRVAQDPRQPRVLHVARAAERLERFARHGHRLLGRRRLHDRREEAQELRLFLRDGLRLLLAEQRHGCGT